MELPSAGSVWMVVFPGLVTLIFGSMLYDRFGLVRKSWRAGDRLELIRSGIVAVMMSLFTAGAAYVSVVDLIGLLTGHGR